MPRFLADESCDYSVVRALRGLGLDVLAVAELSPRADDETVIDVALRDKRILLAEDKDFGQLVLANGLPSAGVVLLRFPAGARSRIADAVSDFVTGKGDDRLGRFVVIQPGRIRMSLRHGDWLSGQDSSQELLQGHD